MTEKEEKEEDSSINQSKITAELKIIVFLPIILQ